MSPYPLLFLSSELHSRADRLLPIHHHAFEGGEITLGFCDKSAVEGDQLFYFLLFETQCKY